MQYKLNKYLLEHSSNVHTWLFLQIYRRYLQTLADSCWNCFTLSSSLRAIAANSVFRRFSCLIFSSAPLTSSPLFFCSPKVNNRQPSQKWFIKMGHAEWMDANSPTSMIHRVTGCVYLLVCLVFNVTSIGDRQPGEGNQPRRLKTGMTSGREASYEANKTEHNANRQTTSDFKYISQSCEKKQVNAITSWKSLHQKAFEFITSHRVIM